MRPSNKRRVTNIGVFCQYILNYLSHHEKISKKKPFLVRALPPTEKGMGIEIQAYYEGTDDHGYENVTAETFDHLLAIIREFDLDVYQLPSDSMLVQQNRERFVPETHLG